ncbi:MAG: homocysteine S-methyltransferase family protein [Pseudomonadota bacterium]
MSQAKYRNALPQMAGDHMLTDGGLETTLIFHDGLDLPYFAAFDLLRSVEGRAALEGYYTRYTRIAQAHGVGFILDSPTWRASADWGVLMEYSTEDLALANRAAIALLCKIRARTEGTHAFVISGNIGPRGDGYNPASLMSPDEASDYHDAQIATFSATAADMLSALTMTHAGEARGIARAAARHGMPLALSFTLETDGNLPTGQSLADAIAETDADTPPSYYMINCAHPDHFRHILEDGAEWIHRIKGVRANASRMSHAELDCAEELDDGNPVEFGVEHAELSRLMPALRVYGGCCGTDDRHVESLAHNCMCSSRAVA